jgi:hypothetical protein
MAILWALTLLFRPSAKRPRILLVNLNVGLLIVAITVSLLHHHRAKAQGHTKPNVSFAQGPISSLKI